MGFSFRFHRREGSGAAHLAVGVDAAYAFRPMRGGEPGRKIAP